MSYLREAENTTANGDGSGELSTLHADFEVFEAAINDDMPAGDGFGQPVTYQGAWCVQDRYYQDDAYNVWDWVD